MDRAPIVFGSILRVFELEEAISTVIWEITQKHFSSTSEHSGLREDQIRLLTFGAKQSHY